MSDNPYQPPTASCKVPVQVAPKPLLVWYSRAIIGFCFLLSFLILLALAVEIVELPTLIKIVSVSLQAFLLMLLPGVVAGGYSMPAKGY